MVNDEKREKANQREYKVKKEEEENTKTTKRRQKESKDLWK